MLTLFTPMPLKCPLGATGFITVSTTWQDRRYAFLTITDSGTRMDEVTKKQVFEPFLTTDEMGKGRDLTSRSYKEPSRSIMELLNAYTEPRYGTRSRNCLIGTGAEIVSTKTGLSCSTKREKNGVSCR